MAKLRLIDDWKTSYKFASVQWSVIGLSLMGLVEAVNQAWISLPPEVVDKIPNSPTIAAVLYGLVIVGRVFTVKGVVDE